MDKLSFPRFCTKCYPLENFAKKLLATVKVQKLSSQGIAISEDALPSSPVDNIEGNDAQLGKSLNPPVPNKKKMNV